MLANESTIHRILNEMNVNRYKKMRHECQMRQFIIKVTAVIGIRMAFTNDKNPYRIVGYKRP